MISPFKPRLAAYCNACARCALEAVFVFLLVSYRTLGLQCFFTFLRCSAHLPPYLRRQDTLGVLQGRLEPAPAPAPGPRRRTRPTTNPAHNCTPGGQRLTAEYRTAPDAVAATRLTWQRPQTCPPSPSTSSPRQHWETSPCSPNGLMTAATRTRELLMDTLYQAWRPFFVDWTR